MTYLSWLECIRDKNCYNMLENFLEKTYILEQNSQFFSRYSPLFYDTKFLKIKHVPLFDTSELFSISFLWEKDWYIEILYQWPLHYLSIGHTWLKLSFNEYLYFNGVSGAWNSKILKKHEWWNIVSKARRQIFFALRCLG